jgi:hypothetical protein
MIPSVTWLEDGHCLSLSSLATPPGPQLGCHIPTLQRLEAFSVWFLDLFSDRTYSFYDLPSLCISNSVSQVAQHHPTKGLETLTFQIPDQKLGARQDFPFFVTTQSGQAEKNSFVLFSNTSPILLPPSTTSKTTTQMLATNQHLTAVDLKWSPDFLLLKSIQHSG